MRNQVCFVRRRAFTLIELLVTIAIVTGLAALALPTLRNSLREQRVARSTGLIAQYMEEARSRAIASGKPVGVILERGGSDNEVNRSQVVRLKICNTPPQYVGDLGGSVAEIKAADSAPSAGNPYGYVVLWFDQITAQLLTAAASGNNSAIRVGDTILVGQDRLPRRILALNAPSASTINYERPNSTLTPPYERGVEIVVAHSPPGFVPFPVENKIATVTPYAKVPYEIIRQPGPSYVAPLEIPDNTVIDLLYSGTGLDGTEFSPLTIEARGERTATSGFGYDPTKSLAFNEVLATLPAASATVDPLTRDYMSVWLIFDPDGALRDIYRSELQDMTPGNADVRPGPLTSPVSRIPLIPYRYTALSDVYLLVGRTGQVRPEAPLGDPNTPKDLANLFDPQATWVVINRMSGAVTSAPCAIPNLLDPSITLPATMFAKVSAAVRLARQYVGSNGLTQ